MVSPLHWTLLQLTEISALGPILALAVCLLSVSLARGQVSPGALSRAHARFDKMTACLECHSTGGGSINENCLNCHEGIAWAVERERGLHGQAELPACTRCHTEHAGREFTIIEWKKGAPEEIDHARTGWPLRGKHGSTKCRDCHKQEFQISPVMALLERQDRALSWFGLEQDCLSCHKDPHEGRLGRSCTECHVEDGWKVVKHEKFDHRKTRYPLEGGHRGLECQKCHDPQTAWGTKPSYDSCSACHRDPHAGRATRAGESVDCSSCHNVERFKPSIYSAADHQRSRYPLEGRHAKVKCVACHPKNPAGVSLASLGSAGVLLRPRFKSCRDCHEAAHLGQLARRPDKGACESCHRVDGFKPSTYTVEKHAETQFALLGKHAEVECSQCHGPERKGLPPVPGEHFVGKGRVALALGQTSCAACHIDPHAGRYSLDGPRPTEKGCLACHDHSAFRPSRIDVAAHQTYSFPLRGAHLAVPCQACHKELDRPTASETLLMAVYEVSPLRFDADRRRCRDCHETPHGVQFEQREDGGACQSCHGENSFRPANRFDHDDKSRFPLKGAHRQVKCEKCHASVNDESGRAMVVYRPIASECRRCHAAEDLGPLAQDTDRDVPSSTISTSRTRSPSPHSLGGHHDPKGFETADQRVRAFIRYRR
ncbi:MAG: hypothetical protein JSV80_11600 [Acidobacteriota bacterium]|nr:MAG: hypothetical protein JSV80_11600 [Acidobacteriota bacterium]